MAIDERRLQRLKDEGVVVGDLSKALEAVIDGLTPEEEEVIIAVHRRLEEADRVTRIEGPKDFPGYSMAIHF
jgi:hypothetical protein